MALAKQKPMAVFRIVFGPCSQEKCSHHSITDPPPTRSCGKGRKAAIRGGQRTTLNLGIFVSNVYRSQVLSLPHHHAATPRATSLLGRRRRMSVQILSTSLQIPRSRSIPLQPITLRRIERSTFLVIPIQTKSLWCDC